MHDKKNHINKSRSSIQGLRPMSKSLPHGLKTILKKGGHNYSSIINNWSNLVGRKIANICYPKSIKTGKELKNGLLFLNVAHGDQLQVEYSKREIIDKINVFFGYQFVKEIKIILIKEKIETKKNHLLNKNIESKYYKKLEKIDDSKFKKKLQELIGAYDNKKN
tara:strand:- start:498 stop:989 length:492 start_codon:yes stop_codon:yes gene_type:complete